MLHIKRFTSNPVIENAYLVYDDNLHGALIDCGAYTDGERDRIDTFLADNHIQLEKVLQTHAHFDHVFGLPHIYARFQLRPYLHGLDLPIYHSFHQMIRSMGLEDRGETQPPVGEALRDGDLIYVGSEALEVIHTPGHTPGSVCFYCKAAATLFSGDTLFHTSIGRTDFPLSSHEMILSSIRERLLTLPPETLVLSGHGGRTTIDHELRFNPYIG